MIRIVLDTSVLVAALRSRSGASFKIVSLLPSARFQICLSIGLYCEWLSVLTRAEHVPQGLTRQDIEKFVYRLTAFAHPQDISFLWRPFLQDPIENMVLELAFAAGARYIVTHNLRDFAGSDQLGVRAILPRDFLKVLCP